MNQDFNVEAALESARRATSLMIREQFTPRSLQDTDALTLIRQRLALAPQLVQQISHSYHFYFTYPWKLLHPGNFDGTPTGSSSNFIRNLHDIHPVFTRAPDSYFLEQMEVLNTAIVEGINNMDPDLVPEYGLLISTILSLGLNKMKRNSPPETETSQCFNMAVTDPCKEILSNCIESLETDCSAQVLDHNVFTPDITFKAGGIPLLVVEMKRTRLKNFVRGGHLDRGNARFQSIIKQVTSCLIRCDLPWGLISDFETTIFIESNISPQHPPQLVIPRDLRNGKEIPPYVEVPYMYKVIYNTDADLTLQSIVASLLYDRYLTIQQDRGDGITVDLKDDFHSKVNLKDPQSQAMYKALIKDTKTTDAMTRTRNQTVIQNMIQKAKQFREVDNHKLERVINLEIDVNDLDPIRVGLEHISQVFKLPSKYLKFFDHSANNSNNQKEVVMKLYNFNDLEANLELKRDWWKDWFGRGFNQNHLNELVGDFFLTEARCYTRIQESKDNIRTPWLYDYGVLDAKLSDQTHFSGFFFLMSYIESTEEDKKITEYLKSFEQPGGTDLFDLLELVFPMKYNDIEVDLSRQAKLLSGLGINHNDWKLSNVKLSNGKFTIFDFSHAKFRDAWAYHELK